MARTIDIITSQTQQAKSDVQSQAAEQRQSIEQQVKASQEALRKSKSTLERQTQEARTKIQAYEAKRAKQAQVPGYEAAKAEGAVAAKEAMKEVQASEQSAKEEIKSSEKELAEAKKKAIAEVEAATKEAETAIEEQEKERLSQLTELQKDNVELDYTDSQGNTQWVSKDLYNSLDTEKQNYLNKNGLDAFKSRYYVTVHGDELVDREFYESLPDDDKKYLRTNGLDKFNALMIERSYEDYVAMRDSRGLNIQFTEAQWKKMSNDYRNHMLSLNSYGTYKQTALAGGASVNDIMTQARWLKSDSTARSNAFDKVIDKYYVALDKGGIVTKEFYNSIPAEQQVYLKNNGVDAWRSEYNITLDYVDPETGQKQVVPKTYWESLTPEEQQKLKSQGLSNFQYNQVKEIADAGNTSFVTISQWNAMDEQARNDLINRITASASYTQFKNVNQAGFWQDYTISEWNALSQSMREQIIRTIINRTEYDVYSNNVPNPVSLNTWYSMDDKTRAENMSLATYNQYKNLWENSGAKTLDYSQSDWNKLSNEERIKVTDDIINKHYIRLQGGEILPQNTFNALPGEMQAALRQGGSKGLDEYIDENYITLEATGELYPLKSFTDDKGQVITGYNDLPAEYKTTLNNGGIAALNTLILEEQAEFDTKYIQLGNGDYMDRAAYNSLSASDQKLIMSVGVNNFNAQKQTDYVKSLPEAAQKYIKTYGLDNYEAALNNAVSSYNQGNTDNALLQLQAIGTVPDTATSVELTDTGEISYTSPQGMSGAQIINLDNVDYKNLTRQDYWNIIRTVITNKTGGNEKLNYPLLVTNYSAVRDYINTLTPEQRKAVQSAADSAARTQAVDIIASVFPPAIALRDDVTISKVRPVDWAVGIAQVGLLVALPVLGSISKIGATAARAATVSGQALKAGATAVFVGAYVKDYAEMSLPEKVLNGAINIAFVGALYGRPILSGLRSLDAKLTVKMNNLVSAVRAKSAARIKAAATELENYKGLSAKTAKGIQNQAGYFIKNADAIANNKITLPKTQEGLLTKISNAIAKFHKSERGELKISKQVEETRKAQAQTWIKAREEFSKWQREEALGRGGTVVTQMERSPALSEQARRSRVIEMPITRREYEVQKLVESMISQIEKSKWGDIQKAVEEGKEVQKFVSRQTAGGAERRTARSEARYSEVLRYATQEEKDAFWGRMAQRVKDTQRKRVKNAIEKVLSEVKNVELKEMKLIRELVTGDATPAQIARAKAQISAVNAEKVMAQAQNMSASAAMQYALRNNMVTAAIAHNANFTAVYEKANNQTQARVQTRVSPDLAKQLKILANEKSSAEAKAQARAAAQTIAKTEIQTLTSVLTAAETATQALVRQSSKALAEAIVATSTKTELDTKVEIETKVNTATKPITDTELREQIKSELRSQIETMVKTKPETKSETKVAQAVKVKPIEKTKAEKPRKYFRIKLPSGKIAEFTKEQWEGKVGWKQGLFYWLIYPPYGENDRIVTRKKIAGIPYHSGIKSAYRSIIRLGGKIPPKIFRDMGIVDITITTPPKGRPVIKFKADPKQRTRVTRKNYGEVSTTR